MSDPELLGDFHVHSTYSDDARSSVAENIEAAVAVGLTELRLVDHVRRSTPWVDDFLATVERAWRPDSLTVYTGVETKLLATDGSLDLPDGLKSGRGGVDAIVVGDHQFPGPEGPWSPDETRARLADGLSHEEAIEQYIQASVNAMALLEHGQLAHWFSIFPKVGLTEDELSDDQLVRWSGAAAENGTILEVNEKWGCPGSRSIRAARRSGATIVASSDSHWAGAVGRYSRVPAILADARRD